VKLAGSQDPLATSIELGECGEDHRSDRHIDADAERVGATDHLQQSLLSECLDQPPVLRQHAGVMDADPRPQHPRQRRAETAGEPEASDRFHNGMALCRVDELHAHQALGLLGRGGLAGMHQIYRCTAGVNEFGEGLGQRGHRPCEDQRHRTLGLRDDLGRTSGALGQLRRQVADIAQGGAHEHELGLRQFAGGDLPRPAAVGVGDEVVLVGHHHLYVGLVALAQRDIGQDLGGAADDRRIRIHRGVAGDHADQIGAEIVHPAEELLADKGLDGRCVVDATAIGQRRDMRRGGDQRFSGPGRGGDDRVRAGHGRQQRIRLVGIERHALTHGPVFEGRVDVVRRGAGAQFVQKQGKAGLLGHMDDSVTATRDEGLADEGAGLDQRAMREHAPSEQPVTIRRPQALMGGAAGSRPLGWSQIPSGD